MHNCPSQTNRPFANLTGWWRYQLNTLTDDGQCDNATWTKFWTNAIAPARHLVANLQLTMDQTTWPKSVFSERLRCSLQNCILKKCKPKSLFLRSCMQYFSDIVHNFWAQLLVGKESCGIFQAFASFLSEILRLRTGSDKAPHRYQSSCFDLAIY